MNGKGVYVEKGDVIIGKVLTKSNKNGEEEQEEQGHWKKETTEKCSSKAKAMRERA